jgi:N-acetylmuramate 1-kinase
MKPMDLPPAIRRGWLDGRYPSQLLTAEASDRRYFRSDHPDTRGWLRVTSSDSAPLATTEFLQGVGVRVPRLADSKEGVYLVEDLGDRHLAHEPTLTAYREVLQMRQKLADAHLPNGHANSELALDEALFLHELAIFRESYLFGWRKRETAAALQKAAQGNSSGGTSIDQGQLATAVDPGVQAAQMRKASEIVAAQAAAGPQCLQHRDFHSRNVLLPAEGGVALIDHQDLRRGPLYYDLASLLTDAYLDLPCLVRDLLQDQIEAWAPTVGLSPEQAAHHYRWTALQRVLKALGTFGRLLQAGREEYRHAELRAVRHAADLLMDLKLHHDLQGCEVLLQLWMNAGWTAARPLEFEVKV